MCDLPFDLIALGNEVPPSPILPPVLRLKLVFDGDGHLLAGASEALIGNRSDIPPDTP